MVTGDITVAGEINLIATSHRRFYPVLQSPQQAYVLLEVLPAGRTSAGSAQPVNFCLVLDRSGSMAGDKLNAMKAAALTVVERLGPEDRLAVVVFDDSKPAELVAPVGPVSDRAALRRKIEAIEERGGTHMSTGMTLGLQEALRGYGPERVSSILLLTDGQTWEDADECRSLADQCRSAGIPIQVLGLGVGAESNWDPKLLEDLARRSGGEWMVVESPQAVGRVFEEKLHWLQGAAAANVSLTIRLAPGAVPRAVWRVSPLISRLDPIALGEQDVQIFLGDIRRGIGQSVLADLALPSRAPGTYRLLQADVTYDVPGLGLTEQRAAAELAFTFAVDSQAANDVDQRLMNLIERVTAHRLQTQALDEAAAGNAAKATQRLRAAATRLLDLGEVEMARQAEGQATLLEQGNPLDLADAQRMRYATKRLTLTDIEGG